MTRRDYCLLCNEMVDDDTPSCVNCNKDFCNKCIETYDPQSRLAFHRILNTATKDIPQFISDIQSPEVNLFLEGSYPIYELQEDEDNTIKRTNEYNKEVVDTYCSMRDKIIKLYEINSNSDELILAINRIFYLVFHINERTK